MKLLLLTFYYPPDLSAGSFRAKALVDALLAEAGTSLQIDVITTLPNRYHTHLIEAESFEESAGLTIRRIALPAHQSGMFDQVKAFTAFARTVLSETQGRQWDLVVATSSRLMTGVLGGQVAKRLNIPLYLDIRDLFTDTMGDLLSGNILRVLLPKFRWLERRTLRSADRVNLVSAGFLSHAREIEPRHDYRVFTNGIDDDFLEIDFSSDDVRNDSLPLVVYAGNMGEGQGLHNVMPETAQLLEGKVRFRFLGGGGRREQLEKALAEAAVTNVEVLNPVPRFELNKHYRDADVLFLHLNDHAAFCKVLPSKLFEYAATGKPILAGVAGHAAEFIRKEIPGAEVFEPCNATDMASALERLLTIQTPIDRSDFCARFARKKIMHEMAKDVLTLGTIDKK